jgi:tryptophan-rich sensory protein
MWVMIVATIIQFKGVIGNLAVVLLGPYLLWVSYASALTLWIWQNNLPSTARNVSARCTVMKLNCCTHV